MFFLIQTENELQIVPVSQEKEKEFHEKYHPRILTEGVSIQDALRKFEGLPLIIRTAFSFFLVIYHN